MGHLVVSCCVSIMNCWIKFSATEKGNDKVCDTHNESLCYTHKKYYLIWSRLFFKNDCAINHSKEIVSDGEDLSLSLPSQLSTPQKKASNVNKEPKKDMIMCLTDKQDSWKQVKILSRVGNGSKRKSGKYKNDWNVWDDQGYTKVIDCENGVEEWEEIKSDYDDKMTKSASQSISHLSKSLSDLQIGEKGCYANSTDEILVNQMYVTQVNLKILNAKEKELQS